ncbi:hypothetical protein MFIFM68171_09630 [Madurella fahalii]|uniref:Rhodopsin domain-containing protein n=1 Tax=Madurella fahalii TaxID=1157608 RepID=A0ABQ0GNV5_9PEZI
MNFSASAHASAESPTAHTGIGGTGPNQIAAAFITWAVAAIFVFLRIWTRVKIVGVVRVSDWVIILSVAAALGQCISKIHECLHGIGKHIQDIDFAAESYSMLQAWWCTLFTYNLTLSLTKISICSLYLTIFTLHWARRACIAVLVVVLISSIWSIVAVATAAIPLQALWDLNVKATFLQSDTTWWSLAGLTIATDLLIFILPMPMIAPLKLPRRQKVLVVGTFALGFFVCIVSFIRIGMLIQSARMPDPDWTYNGANLTYWTLIEVHTGIVVACLMTLKPFVSKYFPNLIGRPQNGDGAWNEAGIESSSDRPLTIGSKPARVLFAGRWASSRSRARAGNEVTLQGIKTLEPEI